MGRFDPSLLVESFLAIHFFGGHKEKDHVDPPALSRIRHFIMKKIAYDLKQIQYAKQYLDIPRKSASRLLGDGFHESSDLGCGFNI